VENFDRQPVIESDPYDYGVPPVALPPPPPAEAPAPG
jgi:hypothetical protein